ncbi:hypothetical protein DPMN_041434 [Dreissena polymorpha]|uniref:Uncharacterized protein n=1 Tax=Dreissena polymorpha TaxID=45954 RepID=A0A9D4CZE2_DREPO|nr:hypothetical protein DPMN_041434 [Dreissena polymorpha]
MEQGPITSTTSTGSSKLCIHFVGGRFSHIKSFKFYSQNDRVTSGNKHRLTPETIGRLSDIQGKGIVISGC